MKQIFSSLQPGLNVMKRYKFLKRGEYLNIKKILNNWKNYLLNVHLVTWTPKNMSEILVEVLGHVLVVDLDLKSKWDVTFKISINTIKQNFRFAHKLSFDDQWINMPGKLRVRSSKQRISTELFFLSRKYRSAKDDLEAVGRFCLSWERDREPRWREREERQALPRRKLWAWKRQKNSMQNFGKKSKNVRYGKN